MLSSRFIGINLENAESCVCDKRTHTIWVPADTQFPLIHHASSLVVNTLLFMVSCIVESIQYSNECLPFKSQLRDHTIPIFHDFKSKFVENILLRKANYWSSSTSIVVFYFWKMLMNFQWPQIEAYCTDMRYKKRLVTWDWCFVIYSTHHKSISMSAESIARTKTYWHSDHVYYDMCGLLSSWLYVLS